MERVERLLLLVTAGLFSLAGRRWAVALADATVEATRIAPAPEAARLPDDTLEALSELVIAGDPFRLSNDEADVRFVAGTEGGAAPPGAPPRGPRPALTLKAIVGGPPWQAVIDGLPGQQTSTVAHDGSVYGGLQVRRVSRDSVVIQGADTTWILTFRGPS
jgi:hypothetical protein